MYLPMERGAAGIDRGGTTCASTMEYVPNERTVIETLFSLLKALLFDVFKTDGLLGRPLVSRLVSRTNKP